jgi:hypothetical protein
MRLRLVITAAVVLASATGGYFLWQTSVAAGVGAAAMAKVACSCVFVDGRSLESCRADDPPGFEDVAVEIDNSAKAATGSVFGLISRRATYSQSYGCTLEP